MAIEYNDTKLKVIDFNGTDITVVKLNGDTIWCKPYTLYITIGSNVANYSVVTTSSEEPSASIGSGLNSGQTIFHGDTLTVNAIAASGYTLNGTYPQTVSVSGDVSISISASLSLTAPVIDGTISDLALGGKKLSLTIYNSNNSTVMCYYTVTGGSDVRSSSQEISPNGNIPINLQYTTSPYPRLFTVEAYFRIESMGALSATTTKTIR